MTTPLWRLSAAELDRAYNERSVSPVEVLRACLDRCAEVNSRLNALVLIDETDARVAAQASETRMRAAGAVLVGKTNTPELALAYELTEPRERSNVAGVKARSES